MVTLVSVTLGSSTYRTGKISGVIDIYVSISVIFRSKIYVKMDSVNISVNISE